MSTNDSSKNSKTPFIVAIALLALGTIGFGVFSMVQSNGKTELTSQLNETEKVKADLEKQYYEALSELEEMRSSNTALNGEIEQKKVELESQKARIDELLRDSRNLDKARSEISKLKQMQTQYVAEINQLREQNAQLNTQNTELSTQNTTLQTDLESQRVANEELNASKAALTSEKEALAQERAVLAKKVDIASVVKISGVRVTGQKLRSGGKTSEKKSAGSIDQLQVCFNTLSNDVVEQNTETFHIRILDPKGNIMTSAKEGSGKFTTTNGEQLDFSKSKDVSYVNNDAEACSVYSPGQDLTKGTYKIEVYNKGFLAGKATFDLR